MNGWSQELLGSHTFASGTTMQQSHLDCCLNKVWSSLFTQSSSVCHIWRKWVLHMHRNTLSSFIRCVHASQVLTLIKWGCIMYVVEQKTFGGGGQESLITSTTEEQLPSWGWWDLTCVHGQQRPFSAIVPCSHVPVNTQISYLSVKKELTNVRFTNKTGDQYPYLGFHSHAQLYMCWP